MTKEEIIEKLLKHFRSEPEEERTVAISAADYEKVILNELERSLNGVEAGTNILTCEDFGHLNVTCCEICHTFYPHYDMVLIKIESGGNAWVCCATNRALNPQKHARLEQSSTYKEMERVFFEDPE